jgi:hypothetical protein
LPFHDLGILDKTYPAKAKAILMGPQTSFGNSMNMTQEEGKSNSELQELLADENADDGKLFTTGGTWS